MKHNKKCINNLIIHKEKEYKQKRKKIQKSEESNNAGEM